MANELDAIKARLGERNVSDAEIGKLVGQAVNSSAEPQALAEILQAAYAKMGNKEIVYDPKAIVAESKEVTPEDRIARARARKAEYGIESIKPKEKSKEVVAKGSKKAIKAAEKAEKQAEKEAAKAAKKAAKDSKKKKGLTDIQKDFEKNQKANEENNKKLQKLKEERKRIKEEAKRRKKEEKDKKKGKNEQEPKTAADKDKQMLDKIEKLKLKGLDIKEQGACWKMKVQDAKGNDVLVDVTSAVEKIRGINDKIDQANGIIENVNKSNAKPDVSLSPQSASIEGKGVAASDGKDAAAPTVPTAAPEVPAVSPEAVDAVKKETFAAELADFKSPEGVTLSEKDIKFLAETALDRFNDEKILKKLKEKEKEESKKEHGDAPKSLATPTQVVGQVR